MIPSVSKIIKFSKSEESKKRLTAWGEKVGKGVQDKNIKRGNNLHELVDLFFKGLLLDPEDTGDVYFDRVLPLLKVINLFKTETELTINYTKNNTPFCGRIDILSNNNLFEIKTVSKPPHKEALEDYRLQMGAYCLALNDMRTFVDNSILLFVYPDRNPLMEKVDIQLYSKLFGIKLKNYYDNIQVRSENKS